MKKKSLIIHGHFYQPPRENPWNCQIELQPSAAPYSNWNEKITSSCYAANCFSREIDSEGRITSITNNYTNISYNFGPTLLSWLEINSPVTYKKIIESDYDSRKLFNGHGNAVAQAYNHTILPLASDDEIEVQIKWSLIDFKKRFGRDSEGFWLAETAINYKIVDSLIEAGIKYTILSPWQADAFKLNKEWKKVTGAIDSSKPYKIVRDCGELAVFFYDPDLASGISFNHYLRNADTLIDKLHSKAEKAEGNLINSATDGEIYGHHEPFGDMCLAALSKKVKQSKILKLDNYGNFLENNKPVIEVKLREGKNLLGTSWSCSHGVSRWYEDCGCSTGSPNEWNQKWRKHFRNGLDAINKSIKRIFKDELNKRGISDHQKWIIEYGKVLASEITPESFVNDVMGTSTSTEEQIELITLFEGIKYSHFMYTSCGWFFNDISGIEPVQNLKYGCRAIEIFSEYSNENLTELFISYLQKAKSNIPEKIDGKHIYLMDVLPNKKSVKSAAASFIFLELNNIEKECCSTGCYRLKSIYCDKIKNNGAVGELSIELIPSQKEFQFRFTADPIKDNVYKRIRIESVEDGESMQFSIAILPLKIRKKIFSQLRKKNLAPINEFLINSLDIFQTNINNEYDIVAGDDNISNLATSAAINLSISGMLSDLEECFDNCSSEKLELLEKLLSFADRHNIEIEKDYFVGLCSSIIANVLETLIDDRNFHLVETLYNFVKILWKYHFNPVKPYTQNIVYEAFSLESDESWMEDLLRQESNLSTDELNIIVDEIAQIMNINRSVMKVF